MGRFSLRLLLAVLLPLASSGLARADLDFGVSGNSLIVTIVDDIHLTFDVGFTSDVLAVRFENTIPLESDALQRPIAPSPSSVLGGGLPGTSEVVQQYFGGDIVFSYIYTAPITVSAGDTFTLPAGIYTVSNWFNGGGVLPSAPTTAIMYSKVGGPLIQVSTAQAVPEPGTSVLLAVGGLVLLFRRRRSSL
jgi:hypothetical protein